MINIKTFLIVDGHSLAHRGFHALRDKLSAYDGTPTYMIVGFMNMLFRVQDEFSPDCTVIVFDASTHNSGQRAFRYELDTDYKSNRQPMPEDLRVQLPILQDLLRFLRYRVVVRDFVEADDVVASIARLAQKNDYEALVLSSDKDLFQVLDKSISLIRPVKHGITGAEIYDSKTFCQEYGFMPSSMADYLALTGDSIDNIKGVPGIGDKGARKILAEYPTIERIFESLDELPKTSRAKLEAAGFEHIIWTRDNLVRLRQDIFDRDKNFLDDCMNYKPDIPKAEELAARLGLKRLLDRMGSKRKVIPKILSEDSHKSVVIDSEILIDDYKSALKNNPELFSDSSKIWDLKTAYYLLHPDEASFRFADIAQYLSSTTNPAKTLTETACGLQAEILSHEGLIDVMNNIDLPLIPILNQLEQHGVRLSPEQFEHLQSELEARVSEIEQEIINETGVRINVNSPQQVSWLLFDRMGFTPQAKTKSKTSYSTDSSVLERLAKLNNGRVPALILEYRELAKMLSSFVLPFQRSADQDGIIHTTFEPAVTGTGRLSSRDPNLQNIPAFGKWAERIKMGLVPVEEGNVFVGADYSQIELRVLAHLSGEERLLEAFRQNKDIHTQTASWVFGVEAEFVTPELRRTAKMINFGLLYGMTEFGLSDRLNISRQESKEIMAKYFSAVPGLQNFMESIIDEAKSRGYTRTLAGRIRPVDEIPAKAQALDRALINSPIQGTAADIARKAVINFARKYPGKLFLQVHDSLVCECREGEAEEISEGMREIMKASGGEIEHLEVETKSGKSLADV